jgi:hypothetical protein
LVAEEAEAAAFRVGVEAETVDFPVAAVIVAVAARAVVGDWHGDPA